MQPERNGFEGVGFGGSDHGIHLATGPDWMHCMQEGLGKHIVDMATTMFKTAGKTTNIITFFVMLMYYFCRHSSRSQRLLSTTQLTDM